jgi:hypothetical protein
MGKVWKKKRISDPTLFLGEKPWLQYQAKKGYIEEISSTNILFFDQNLA